jgi:hypothetical protein
MPKLSDNQVGDRLTQRYWRLAPPKVKPPWKYRVGRGRQTLSLLQQGILIAAEKNSDDVSVVISQPIVSPSD